MDSIGANVQEARKSRGLKQKELAELIGITAPSLSSFERGKSNVTLDTMIKISNVLDIPIDVLLGVAKEKIVVTNRELKLIERLRKNKKTSDIVYALVDLTEGE